MQELYLQRNSIRKLGIVKMEKLEKLVLDENLISDLSEFSRVPNLKTLSLRSNQIETMKKSRFPELVMLDLGYNRILELGDLSGFQKL